MTCRKSSFLRSLININRLDDRKSLQKSEVYMDTARSDPNRHWLARPGDAERSLPPFSWLN